jgi:Mrp family chromosome partitioning ATPase
LGGGGGRHLHTAVLWPNILAQSRSRYDLVVVDGPPALAGNDARMLARLMDATLLATRTDRNSAHASAAAADALRRHARSAPIVASVEARPPTAKEIRRRTRRA